MLGTWEGGCISEGGWDSGALGGKLDSGSSCWTLGREAGIFMLDTWEGGWESGSSCWALGGGRGGIVDVHVRHMGGRLG